MADGTDVAPAPADQPLLSKIVEGLKHDPVLQFGLGAGTVLVSVLATTTNVWLVLIVAGVLVLSLGAWVMTETRKPRELRPHIRNTVRGEHAKIRDSTVGVARGGGSVEQTIDISNAEVDNSTIGESTIGKVG